MSRDFQKNAPTWSDWKDIYEQRQSFTRRSTLRDASFIHFLLNESSTWQVVSLVSSLVSTPSGTSATCPSTSIIGRSTRPMELHSKDSRFGCQRSTERVKEDWPATTSVQVNASLTAKLQVNSLMCLSTLEHHVSETSGLSSSPVGQRFVQYSADERSSAMELVQPKVDALIETHVLTWTKGDSVQHVTRKRKSWIDGKWRHRRPNRRLQVNAGVVWWGRKKWKKAKRFLINDSIESGITRLADEEALRVVGGEHFISLNLRRCRFDQRLGSIRSSSSPPPSDFFRRWKSDAIVSGSCQLQPTRPSFAYKSSAYWLNMFHLFLFRVVWQHGNCPSCPISKLAPSNPLNLIHFNNNNNNVFNL